MTAEEHRQALRGKLEAVERQIESYKATTALLEIERQRLKYMLNEHTRSVPRMET